VSTEENKYKNQLCDMRKFMRVLSHDLRNPLINVQALVQEAELVIEQGKAAPASGEQQTLAQVFDEDLAEILDMLKTSAHRMDDILAATTEMYAGVFEAPECEVVDMYQMFQRCFTLMDLQAQGVELHCETMPKAYADPLLLQRIIRALLSNAHKAMVAHQQPCPQLIHVEASVEGQQVWFHIEDTGCGFDESDMAQAFEPFFVGKHFVDGLGMGLTSAKVWIEHMDGSILVESKTNKTMVSFCLPAVT